MFHFFSVVVQQKETRWNYHYYLFPVWPNSKTRKFLNLNSSLFELDHLFLCLFLEQHHGWSTPIYNVLCICSSLGSFVRGRNLEFVYSRISSVHTLFGTIVSSLMRDVHFGYFTLLLINKLKNKSKEFEFKYKISRRLLEFTYKIKQTDLPKENINEFSSFFLRHSNSVLSSVNQRPNVLEWDKKTRDMSTINK